MPQLVIDNYRSFRPSIQHLRYYQSGKVGDAVVRTMPYEVEETPLLKASPDFWWMNEVDRSNAFEARALAYGGSGYRAYCASDDTATRILELKPQVLFELSSPMSSGSFEPIDRTNGAKYTSDDGRLRILTF
jgi:hypothetical protein